MMKFLKDKFKLSTEKKINYKEIIKDKKEENVIIYYKFKESIARMEYSNIHYLDHTFSNLKNSSYSFKNKSFINKTINNLIYKFSDSIFEEQLFYNLLERDIHQNNPQGIYLKIYNNLIKQIQQHIDIIVESRLMYFTGGVAFYKEYNKFKTDDNLNYFLIEGIFKELTLNEYYLTFQLKNNYDSILLGYFKQIVIYIRENEGIYNYFKIKSEINRLKSEVLKNEFLFLKGYIEQLEELKNDLDYFISKKNKNLKTTEVNNIYNSSKKFTKEQKILLHDFLNNWFKDPISEDIQNLINLNLPSLKGSLNLEKGTRSLSLLFVKLIEKKHYTINDILSIYDYKKLISYKNNTNIKKTDFQKHLNYFKNPKNKDVKTKGKNEINLLLKSF